MMRCSDRLFTLEGYIKWSMCGGGYLGLLQLGLLLLQQRVRGLHSMQGGGVSVISPMSTRRHLLREGRACGVLLKVAVGTSIM
jgi:hypothetical protein